MQKTALLGTARILQRVLERKRDENSVRHSAICYDLSNRKIDGNRTPIAKTITFEALCHDGASCPTEYEAPQVNNVLIWHLLQLMASF